MCCVTGLREGGRDLYLAASDISYFLTEVWAENRFSPKKGRNENTVTLPISHHWTAPAPAAPAQGAHLWERIMHYAMWFCKLSFVTAKLWTPFQIWERTKPFIHLTVGSRPSPGPKLSFSTHIQSPYGICRNVPEVQKEIRTLPFSLNHYSVFLVLPS